jgi:hypothetical protein
MQTVGHPKILIPNDRLTVRKESKYKRERKYIKFYLKGIMHDM